MHELSIALSILDIAKDESERRGGALVRAIYARIGQLSGVVPQSLLSAFELARESSPFADCSLVIDVVPVVVYCGECNGERPIDSVQMMQCGVCGTPAFDVVSGCEMEITAMEVEESSSELSGNSSASTPRTQPSKE